VAERRIAVVGGGNLGGSFVAGYLRAGVAVMVVEPDSKKHVQGVQNLSDLTLLPKGADIVVIAVKPQLVGKVCKELAAQEPKCVVSFAAGVTLEALRRDCGPGPQVVRAMGNTAAAFGASITSLVCDGPVPEGVKEAFEPLGEVVVLGDEKQMDGAMAISASAPAFFLMAAEGLSDGGVRLGLSRELANSMAVGAMRAAAAVATHEHMTLAKQRITSPGGTTIVGLAVLETAAVRGAYADAAVATAKRAKELLG
jgi:pyrroline-5-carboxylate reductase